MKKILKKADCILLASVLCVCTVCFLIIYCFVPAGNVAVIKVNNQQKSVMDLNENTKFDVIINNTVTNTVVVEDGFAYVINASCPDKLCQKHKKINKTGESIVCLPNKVVVSIEGSKNTDEIDGVAK